MFAEQLAGFVAEYPDVRVTREVFHSLDSVSTLVNLSRGAQLIVVGSRGRGVVARLLGPGPPMVPASLRGKDVELLHTAARVVALTFIAQPTRSRS